MRRKRCFGLRDMKITPNRLKVFEFLLNSDTWVDINQIAHHTGVRPNVANRYLLIWTRENLVVRNDTFFAYLYRLADDYQKIPLGDKLATGLALREYVAQ